MNSLAGKRVVVTRAAHQAAELAQLLGERGAIPMLYPCIDIAPPTNEMAFGSALQAAIAGTFDWLVLTSVNTVYALQRQLADMSVYPPYFARQRIAAVGAATAEAAQAQLGLQAVFIPETYTAESLAETLYPVAGLRVLLPQSALADSTLARTLASRGAVVTVVEAYQTVMGQGGITLASLLHVGGVDVVTFTSASTVTNCLQRLALEGGSAHQLSSICIACIGPKTAAVARQYNLPVTVMPTEHTLEGLIMTLETYYAEHKTGEPK